MNKTLKTLIYLSSIAWLVFTLISLPNTIEARTNNYYNISCYNNKYSSE